MEKHFALLKLGTKYLYRYRRRYGFLLTALVFGFAVVTFFTTTKDGMYNSVYYSAQAHYAGDIVAIAHHSYSRQTHQMGQNEIAAILNAAYAAGINPRHTVKRTLFGSNGVIHFNGIAIRLKYVVGCDWETEAFLFAEMNFDGEPILPAGDDGILISAPIAMLLGARIGDSVILEVDTRWGQRNTGVFIIRGIVNDFSIFGYHKVYVSRLTLNRLILLGDNDSSMVGFFLQDRRKAEQKRRLLQTALLQEAAANHFHVGALVHNRDEMSIERGRYWDGIKIFLYTLPVYLSEISELMDAMNIITYFLYAMMLIIIFASAAVTYKLIIHERTTEMGIMRAIGFYGGDLRLVLWVEVIVLGLVSLFAGFLLAWLFSAAVSFMSFSWFPSFEIFMTNGRLVPLYLPGRILINMASVFMVLVAATLIPSFRVSKKKLTGLLSGEPL